MPEGGTTEGLSLVHDFAIIMAVAGVAIVIFRRLNQPAIMGYLLAGLLVSPLALPHINVADIESIRRLADLGLLLLLFAIGLEFGWQRIRQIGGRVVLIGAVEISLLMALGYAAGIFLGWSGTEAIFLGAALSISSSAIIVKVLRDSGKLFAPEGRLIVGILVVEDVIAVILLSVLSGVATTESASLRHVGFLVGKLAVFLVSALFFGALFAPRLINFVARFRSQETLLIVSLALCFGLALVAEQLGISGAAGAFLIGTVLGDTQHSRDLAHTMSSVRDMFAALFFVSIGMLVDLSLIGQFIVPALIVTVVFVLGKVVANTVGTFLAGHDGRTSLAVGMGMPQIGEFSLAMVKVGADNAAVGPFLYPVVAATTAITSLTYSYIVRSTDAVVSFCASRSPRLLQQYVAQVSAWLVSARATFNLRGEVSSHIRNSGRIILLNFGLIVVLITSATVVLRFTPDIAGLVGVHESMVGLVVSGVVVALCVPPVVVMWRALRTLTDDLSHHIIRSRSSSSGVRSVENLRALIRYSILIFLTIALAVWSLPLVSQLLLLGRFSAPLPILLLLLVAGLTIRAAFKIHSVLEDTFRQTFLGRQGQQPGEGDGDHP
jgi:CPA2 family monovalent cation:H+ antiporter-2